MQTLTDNRVTTAVARMKAQIADRIAQGLTTAEAVATTRKNLDMSLDEYCAFQECKSLASISGKLTIDEAQTIYTYLGNTPAHFNAQPVEVKVVLTRIYSELIGGV